MRSGVCEARRDVAAACRPTCAPDTKAPVLVFAAVGTPDEPLHMSVCAAAG